MGSNMKAVMATTGVVLTAVILKLSLPVTIAFLTSEVPLLYSLALSWLRPPYLYLLINCIILSIVASSKLQPRGAGESRFPAPEKSSGGDSQAKITMEEREDPVVLFGYVDSRVVKEDPPLMKEREKSSAAADDDEFVLSKIWMPSENAQQVNVMECSPVSPAEKPLVSARFGHRRAVKASPEGKAVLKTVSRPKRQETLESTWRAITDGRPMPLTRHLRKSDTFGGAPAISPVRVMKKSDTFAGGNSSPASGSGGKLRREPSLSHDELNRRIEAFIKKFNDEMRLQRQESLKQYREMVSRGVCNSN